MSTVCARRCHLESGVKVEAHVLDGDGKPIENTTEVVNDGGWGVILHVKPKSTGVYLFVVREDCGNTRKTSVAMITGYKYAGHSDRLPSLHPSPPHFSGANPAFAPVNSPYLRPHPCRRQRPALLAAQP